VLAALRPLGLAVSEQQEPVLEDAHSADSAPRPPQVFVRVLGWTA
jgi:hypothetical protein